MPLGITITNETRGKLPSMSFAAIARTALGHDYELSVVIATAARMKKLNLIYRNKNEPTDILSFPLSKNKGEIYLCPSEARIEAKKFDRPYENFLTFLFIHGCVHLKGYDHGGTMERIEADIRKQFGI